MAVEGKYCFVSDLHLGPDTDPDGARERAFVAFLKSLPADLKGLYLLGDIFDFWLEYHDVVPRGNVRTLAALAEVAERAELWYFGGNHDWWLGDYFEKELGAHIVLEPYRVLDLDGVKVMAGHGDVVAFRDARSRFLAWLFRNKVCIALLKALPPRWVLRFARNWAASSRRRHDGKPAKDMRQEPIYQFVNEYGRKEHIDYYVFGHWHHAARLPVESGGELIIVGDWSHGENFFAL